LALAHTWLPCPTSKRVVDCVLATIMLIFAAPLMVIFALLIRCTSRGPAIYPQIRLGWGDRSFTLYKLRTMQHDCEKLTGPCWAVPNDPRVTRIGRFLRATHMDELPQLWNVLRGEMSLIGPRPERPEIIVKLESSIPRYAERRAVLPGLTGLAQLQLPPDTDFSCVRRKLVYDLHYVERASLGLDCRILLGTACKVLGLSCQVIPPISMVANCDSAPPSRPVALGSGSRDVMPTVRLAKNSTR
jgi:lipopolysaccharide/colanic/teichoic acid biosynthesis glycosyltransferase